MRTPRKKATNLSFLVDTLLRMGEKVLRVVCFIFIFFYLTAFVEGRATPFDRKAY